ncbi:hypothetical protein B296_00052189 [Ensete ventricosum]|uniref:Uncharacterized protein n=1 Tax=Ensete ventricosum TaxID=4639 RepID=A0A426WXA8_ENSVE|nr:hypothetical protein B296_00052189 [Ensete ventricosum]
MSVFSATTGCAIGIPGLSLQLDTTSVGQMTQIQPIIDFKGKGGLASCAWRMHRRPHRVDGASAAGASWEGVTWRRERGIPIRGGEELVFGRRGIVGATCRWPESWGPVHLPPPTTA